MNQERDKREREMREVTNSAEKDKKITRLGHESVAPPLVKTYPNSQISEHQSGSEHSMEM